MAVTTPPTNDAKHRDALPRGAKLHWYEIHSVLGQGGYGITYLARDTNLNKTVAIKEYLPRDVAVRAGENTIHPRNDDAAEYFDQGLRRFLKEAQTLARFKHPNIVRVHSFFEENNTGYMVMEYERGRSLASLVEKRRFHDEKILLGILAPLLDGLEQVHEAGFIHRDIKPANIYLRADGSAVLLDFGAARYAGHGMGNALTSMVTPGYAPIEQYQGSEEHEGPWSDIYALGATCYRLVTGHDPVDALKRSVGVGVEGQDPYIPLVDVGLTDISEAFREAIDMALRFSWRQRPQSISAWREALLGDSRAQSPWTPTQPDAATAASAASTVPSATVAATAPRPATTAQTGEVVLDPVTVDRAMTAPAGSSPATTTSSRKKYLPVPAPEIVAARTIPRWHLWGAGSALAAVVALSLILLYASDRPDAFALPTSEPTTPSQVAVSTERVNEEIEAARKAAAELAAATRLAEEAAAAQRQEAARIAKEQREAEERRLAAERERARVAALELERERARALAAERAKRLAAERAAAEEKLKAQAALREAQRLSAQRRNDNVQPVSLQERPDIDVISDLIKELEVAFETRDLSRMERAAALNGNKRAFVEQVFRNYSVIEVAVSDLAVLGAQGTARAKLTFTRLLDHNGNEVIPGVWKEQELVTRKHTGRWQKIEW